MPRYCPQLKISHGLSSTETCEIFCSGMTRVIYFNVKEAFRTESFILQKKAFAYPYKKTPLKFILFI